MDLKIPKIEVLVDIMFIDREQVAEEFYLYLNHFSPLHKGEQTLEEFINSDQLFIPAKKSLNREFQILNNQSIIYIKEKNRAEESPGASIRIHLRNSQDIEIKLFELLPDFHSRPIDFFNNPRTFLPFIHDRARIYINKNHILRASENEQR
ncbi:MAG: hypothetical protein WCL37_04640 [Chrysiogenales bacterium]